MTSNHIVREETCFSCNETLIVMEYEPYNEMAYIPVTIINGPVINKTSVCHRCFNRGDFQFTESGWTRTVEPEFDRINHGPFEHPVSEPVNALDGVDPWTPTPKIGLINNTMPQFMKKLYKALEE